MIDKDGWENCVTQVMINAKVFGCGFLKFSNTPTGSIYVSVVPIDDYKFLRINDKGFAEIVEV